MNKIKELFGKLLTGLKLISVPVILLYSVGTGITYVDRIKYLFQTIWVSFPMIVLYNHLSSWHDANKLFIEAASIIIFINMIFGGLSHWKQGTFSWKILGIKNFFIIIVVLSTYLVLDKLFGFFADTFVGGMLKSSISFIVLMYPASKFMTSAFIVTNGKFPPMFLMKLFYSFEKKGRIKDFFDVLEGNGIQNAEEFTNELRKHLSEEEQQEEEQEHEEAENTKND